MRRSFEDRVWSWLLAAFGYESCMDRTERNQPFLEEALEVVQANGCSRAEAHALVDNVFDRPAGELEQEIGGALTTLAALSMAANVPLQEAGDKELRRIWAKIDEIRKKQAAKPRMVPASSCN